MKINFHKYQGAGNDFIIVDNRLNIITANKEDLAVKLCDRKFGIGSDGLIFIEHTDLSIFEIDFLNPDGSRSFCGNGSRCAVQFMFDIGDVEERTAFEAIDGEHFAEITEMGVLIEMNDVEKIECMDTSYFAETGSPHYVSYFDAIDDLDIIEFGQKIRYSDTYKKIGTNVNAVEEIGRNHIKVRTYERGVENETLACGTGVTACALSYAILKNLTRETVNVDAVGGKLKVSFIKSDKNSFTDIWLEGPAEFVFKGEVNV